MPAGKDVDSFEMFDQSAAISNLIAGLTTFMCRGKTSKVGKQTRFDWGRSDLQEMNR